MRKRLATLALCTALGLTAAACVPYSGVNTASIQLVAAAGTWNDIPTELKASCARDRILSSQANCQSVDDAAVQLTKGNDILIAYFSAMERASDGKSFTVTGFDDLAPALKAAHANDDQVKAYTGVVQLLAGWVTESQRHEVIDKLLGDGAPKVEDVLTIMHDKVAPAAGIILAAERTTLTATFTNYINDGSPTLIIPTDIDCKAGPFASGFPHYQQYAAAVEYCHRADLITQKQALITQYADSLAKAKDALHALYVNRDRIKAKDLIATLDTQLKALKASADALKALHDKKDAA